MANNVSSLKTACDNVTAVTKAAIKKEPLYLNEKFQLVTDLQQKATVQELFLELGKMYVTSKDSDKDATVSTILGRMKLITQNQETPETNTKSAAILAVISKAFQHLKTAKDQAAFLQGSLSGLAIGKEGLALAYTQTKSSLDVESAEKKRAQFFQKTKEMPGILFAEEFTLAKPVKEATEASLEALTLLLKIFPLSGKTRTEKVAAGKIVDHSMQLKRVTPFILAKLNMYSTSTDPHLRIVAEACLAWYETTQIQDECIQSRVAFAKMQQSLRSALMEPMIAECIPEFIGMWNGMQKHLQRFSENDYGTPELEAAHQVFMQEQIKFWPQFKEAAASRNFFYEFFYEMLNALKKNATGKTNFVKRYFQHAYSSEGGRFPEPSEFAALSVEKPTEALPASITTAAIAAPKPLPKTSLIQKKKPPKKDPFSSFFKEPPVESLNVKTKEPVLISAAFPQIAAADTASSHPLESVLHQGKLFLGKRTFADRVDIWLTDPVSAVETATYKNLSLQNKEAAQWRHGFTPAIDQFLGTRYAVTGSWLNPTTGHLDALHCLVAEVEDEHGKKERCVLQYCEDENHVIYHRFAGLSSNEALIDMAINQKVFEVLEFPAWNVSKNMMKGGKSSKPIAMTVKGAKAAIDPHSNIVTVHDSKYKRTFRLIPLGD